VLRTGSDNPLGQIQTLFQVGTFGGLTDGELLDRFATGSGEISKLAIAVLVERHGPMVRRVCRAILHNPHDADDAFQATFLVLARQAGSIRKRDSIASWLHGVARRVAVCALDAEARRRKHERNASKPEAAMSDDHREEVEMGRIVHDELGRLPEKYRAPIVLCHLEGLTHEQAAHQLHWPVGTVRSRLSRGRDRLRDRLIRRGAAPAVAASACAFAGESASAGVSLSLVRSIVQHASTGTISPSISSLVKGALNAMAMTKLKIAGAMLAVVMTTSGLGLFVHNAIRAESKPEPPKPEAANPVVDVKQTEKPAQGPKFTHADRIDLGRIRVGALAEVEFNVGYSGPAGPGVSLRVEPPPFATVVRIRIFRSKPFGPNGVTMSYEVSLSFNTDRPGDLRGDVKLHHGDDVATIPIMASVERANPTAMKVLAITGGFGSISNDSSDYDIWRKMIKAEKLDVSYVNKMNSMDLNSVNGPDGKERVPDALARYDVILIDGIGAGWLGSLDVYFLKLFVESGKRLIIFASPGVLDTVMKANLVLEPFGLRMSPKDVATPGMDIPLIKEKQIARDLLTDRVNSLDFIRPALITATNPKIAKILDKGLSEEGFLAVSRPGKGEVVAIGTPMVTGWIGEWGKDSDNLRCLRNLLTKPVGAGK
jgi:RNA polymerase sigma factor (sigma-70 family)